MDISADISEVKIRNQYVQKKRPTVDQLMFAAINVCVLANQSISSAINVRDLGSQ